MRPSVSHHRPRHVNSRIQVIKAIFICLRNPKAFTTIINLMIGNIFVGSKSISIGYAPGRIIIKKHTTFATKKAPKTAMTILRTYILFPCFVVTKRNF